jgi:hypothetical protein
MKLAERRYSLQWLCQIAKSVMEMAYEVTMELEVACDLLIPVTLRCEKPLKETRQVRICLLEEGHEFWGRSSRLLLEVLPTASLVVFLDSSLDFVDLKYHGIHGQELPRDVQSKVSWDLISGFVVLENHEIHDHELRQVVQLKVS